MLINLNVSHSWAPHSLCGCSLIWKAPCPVRLGTHILDWRPQLVCLQTLMHHAPSLSQDAWPFMASVSACQPHAISAYLCHSLQWIDGHPRTGSRGKMGKNLLFQALCVLYIVVIVSKINILKNKTFILFDDDPEGWGRKKILSQSWEGTGAVTQW